MKIGQLIEYKVKIFFSKIHAKSEVRRLVPDLFLFFKNVLYEIKASDQHFSSTIFW